MLPGDLIQVGAFAVMGLIAAIALIWLLRLMLVPKGQHSKHRMDRREDAAALHDMIDDGLPDYDGRTYSRQPGPYDPQEYREEHHE
jgi:hypothetical protein